VQKLYFLPHPQSDFIYSIVAEELGLIGALAVVALFALLAWRGLRAGVQGAGRLRPLPRLGLHLRPGASGADQHQRVAVALLPTKGIPCRSSPTAARRWWSRWRLRHPAQHVAT
jgi:cell division protein FtsW